MPIKVAKEQLVFNQTTLYNTITGSRCSSICPGDDHSGICRSLAPQKDSRSNGYPACSPDQTSIVDALAEVGCSDTSFAFRKQIAAANGILDYSGTSEQNMQLLSLLRNGRLKLVEDNTSSVKSTSVNVVDEGVYTGSVGGFTNAITVTKDGAPLRYEADGSTKIEYRAEKGAVLPNLGTKRTGFLGYNKWYLTEYNGETFYIFAGNVEVHSHKYESYSVYGTNFKVCDCGHVTFTTYQKGKVQKAESFAALATAATTAAVVDGPLPVGEIVGAVIVAAGTIYMTTSNSASLSTAQEIATDVDYVEYLKNVQNVCGPTTYRMVERTSPNLTYISDACLNLGEAYVYVRYCQGDVWCENSFVAESLASLNASGYYYDQDKDELTHYMHYHLGSDADHKVGGHIFYGTNDLGQTPT